MKKTLLFTALVFALTRPGLYADDSTNPSTSSSATATSPVSNQDLEQRLTAVEEKLNALNTNTSAPAQSQNAGSTSYDGQGITIQSADGLSRLSLRGWIQVQNRDYFGDTAVKLPVDAFLINEAREYLEGTLWGNTDYRLLTDFKGGTVSLLDAYIDYSFLDNHNLTLRAGKFKAPIGLERLQDSRYNEFIELGLPSNLAPNRDLGYDLSAYVLDKHFLNATAGIFNGSQDGASSATSDTSQTDDKTFEGRIWTQPFYESDWAPVKKLGLGLAGSYGNRNGYSYNTNYSAFVPSSYISAGQQTIFSYNSTVAQVGEESRLAPQGYWYWNRFGLLGEWIRSYQDLSATPAVHAKPVISQIAADAYQVQAFVVLTGEDASFDGVKPRANFDPKNGTFGAFELVALYGDLQLGQDAFSKSLYADSWLSVQEAQESAVGLNWYLNPSLKWQLNWVQTWFHGGAGTSAKNTLDREEEQVALTQIQLSF